MSGEVAVQVHNTRIYTPEPMAIHCMVYDSSSELLALSRSDSSVEVWRLSGAARLQRRLLDTWGSVEGLSWGNSCRLFSCGLHGHVLEHDLATLAVKCSVAVISGACWCLDVHRKSGRIAAGSEEGHISILEITPEGLLFDRTLDKQEGRVLCVSWSPDGSRLASGSPDAVRVWDSTSGHALHRLSTGRDLSNRPCLVWAVRCLDNATFVSGDSRGRLCVWDLQLGVSLEEHQALRGDVLCLDVSKDTIYCSGTEPRIAMFNASAAPGSSGGARCRWSRSFTRRLHTHEVRALAAVGGTKLASGGVDAALLISSAGMSKQLVSFPPLPLRAVSVAGLARVVLLRFSRHLELRRLLPVPGSKLEVVRRSEVTPPQGELILRLEARTGHAMALAEVSDPANWLAFSTQHATTFFTLSGVLEQTDSQEGVESRAPVLEKARDIPRQLQAPLTALAFCGRDAKRAVAAAPGVLLVLQLNHQAASVALSHSLPTAPQLRDLVHLLSVSADRRFLVAADLAGGVACWSDKKWQRSVCLPRSKVEATAMTVAPNNQHLFVAYADHKLIEYDLCGEILTEFSRTMRLPAQLLSRAMRGLSCDPVRRHGLLLHDGCSVFCLDLERLEEASLEQRGDTSLARQQDKHGKRCKVEDKSALSKAVRVVGESGHVLHATWLPEGREIFVLRVSQAQIDDKLPPPPKSRKLFGTHT